MTETKPARCACGGEGCEPFKAMALYGAECANMCGSRTAAIYPTEAEAIAAWNLSCAADKLLEACWMVIRNEPPWLDKMRAAIALAGGEETT